MQMNKKYQLGLKGQYFSVLFLIIIEIKITCMHKVKTKYF